MNKSKSKLSFWTKEKITCPICKFNFQKEELLTGGGRMDAALLTDELRRLYKPTIKFGAVFPLIYPVTVCPQCFYATFPSDFEFPQKELLSSLADATSARQEALKTLYQSVSFLTERSLEEGLASYLLAMLCYEMFPASSVPTFKQALASLRAAWICCDLQEKAPQENYDSLGSLLYKKAAFLFRKTTSQEESGRESIGSLGHLGPDLDNNYGYDGVLYLATLLEFKYGQREDLEKRKKILSHGKIVISRLVGLGKSSKGKPSEFVGMSRTLYDKLKEELASEEDRA